MGNQGRTVCVVPLLDAYENYLDGCMRSQAVSTPKTPQMPTTWNATPHSLHVHGVSVPTSFDTTTILSSYVVSANFEVMVAKSIVHLKNAETHTNTHTHTHTHTAEQCKRRRLSQQQFMYLKCNR